MKSKRLIIILLISILSIGIIIAAGVAIYKWYENQRKGNEISILCIDKNGDIIANQEIRVGGVTNKHILQVCHTDEEGEFNLKVFGTATINFYIVTPSKTYYADKRITKADIKSGEIIIVQFVDYEIEISVGLADGYLFYI